MNEFRPPSPVALEWPINSKYVNYCLKMNWETSNGSSCLDIWELKHRIQRRVKYGFRGFPLTYGRCSMCLWCRVSMLLQNKAVRGQELMNSYRAIALLAITDFHVVLRLGSKNHLIFNKSFVYLNIVLWISRIRWNLWFPTCSFLVRT